MPLTLEEYAAAKQLPIGKLKELGLHDTTHNGHPALGIPYYDQHGKLLFTRLRLSLTESPKFYQPAGIPLYPYGVWLLDTYPPNTQPVLEEGESDFHTLYCQGIPAIGLPGANSLKPEFYPMFQRFATLILAREPDQGGDALEKVLKESPLADQVAILDFTSEAKDVSALYLKDPANFKANLRAMWAKAREMVPLPNPRWSHEVTNKTFPPQPWVIQDIFAQPGLMVISGKEGSMKSWLSLEIGMAVANGTPLWGQFATTQTGVIIIDYENTDHIFHDRMHALCYPQVPPEMSLQYHNEASIGHLTYEDCNLILRMCKKEKASLVIFDSLSRFLGDKEENSSTDMRVVFSHFKQLANNGISCIFLHHNRKPIGFIKSTSSADMRGSSDIAANLNSHWAIEKDEKYGKVNIIQHKLREAEKRYQGFVLGINSNREVGDLKFQFEGAIDQMANKKEHVKEEVIALLGYNDGYLSIKEVIAALEAAGMQAGGKNTRLAIKELLEEGLIKSTRSRNITE